MNLCYLYLFRHNWAKVIEHAEIYKKFVAYEKQCTSFQTENIKKAYNQQQYYCVLSYQLEAYCNSNKFAKAFEVLQQIAQLGYTEAAIFEAINSINTSNFFNLAQTLNNAEFSNQISIIIYFVILLHCMEETIVCQSITSHCRRF